MDSAERNELRSQQPPAAHRVSRPDLPGGSNGRIRPAAALADDIDDLRQKMAEAFLKEASFTADPVILISRELDVKIIEYMRECGIARRKAR